MAASDWHFSIGIPEIDAQHAHWIAIIERFRRAAAGHQLDPQGIEAAITALNELVAYTRQHFACEEKLLQAHAYPRLAEHCRAHREIEQQLDSMRSDLLNQRTRRLSLKLNLFATIWLFEHLLGADADYAEFLRAKGVLVGA